jgi:Protein of unknown function (DUF3307)
VDWVEVFGVFFVSHLAGDFLLQTDWQARNKYGGLGGDPTARRALLTHIGTYGLAFGPAFLWLAGEVGASTILVAGLVLLPHLIQDDGRLLKLYMTAVKRSTVAQGEFVAIAVDQSFHFLALFCVALLAGSY